MSTLLKKQDVLDRLHRGWRLFVAIRLGRVYMSGPEYELEGVYLASFNALTSAGIIKPIGRGEYTMPSALYNRELAQYEIEYALSKEA